MRAERRVYRGIEFVRIDELPEDQQKALQASATFPERIKIIIDGKFHNQCILYSAYSEWHSNVFRKKEIQPHEPKRAQAELAFHKS